MKENHTARGVPETAAKVTEMLLKGMQVRIRPASVFCSAAVFASMVCGAIRRNTNRDVEFEAMGDGVFEIRYSETGVA